MRADDDGESDGLVGQRAQPSACSAAASSAGAAASSAAGSSAGAAAASAAAALAASARSEEHTSELQSLMRNSYAVFCLKKNNKIHVTQGTAKVHAAHAQAS